ncbi:MAG: pyridoxine 5'-phosphate synthase [Myxococcaceae bacterium]
MRQRLGVNIDHVATLRQVRKAAYPDPVTAAALAEFGGADQITLHLREDRRHIQERDLRLLRETCHSELNLEMATSQEMAKIAYEFKPDLVTLVPERREELTTEGGLDVSSQRDSLQKMIRHLKDGEIRVSLFIDPDLEQVRASHRCDADRIELHTGRFANARNRKERDRELSRIVDCAKAAAKLNMGVGAGHGLNYENVGAMAAISEIDELNIGHAIVARAVLVGFENAVREMIQRMVRR